MPRSSPTRHGRAESLRSHRSLTDYLSIVARCLRRRNRLCGLHAASLRTESRFGGGGARDESGAAAAGGEADEPADENDEAVLEPDGVEGRVQREDRRLLPAVRGLRRGERPATCSPPATRSSRAGKRCSRSRTSSTRRSGRPENLATPRSASAYLAEINGQSGNLLAVEPEHLLSSGVSGPGGSPPRPPCCIAPLRRM
jgi:hypothetical protein